MVILGENANIFITEHKVVNLRLCVGRYTYLHVLARHKLAKYQICVIRNTYVMHYFVKQSSRISMIVTL